MVSSSGGASTKGGARGTKYVSFLRGFIFTFYLSASCFLFPTSCFQPSIYLRLLEDPTVRPMSLQHTPKTPPLELVPLRSVSPFSESPECPGDADYPEYTSPSHLSLRKVSESGAQTPGDNITQVNWCLSVCLSAGLFLSVSICLYTEDTLLSNCFVVLLTRVSEVRGRD